MFARKFWRLSFIAHRARAPTPASITLPTAYARDPLAHPAIAAMSPREIADLPADELRAWGC